jgi:hypothetical protein
MSSTTSEEYEQKIASLNAQLIQKEEMITMLKTRTKNYVEKTKEEAAELIKKNEALKETLSSTTNNHNNEVVEWKKKQAEYEKIINSLETENVNQNLEKQQLNEALINAKKDNEEQENKVVMELKNNFEVAVTKFQESSKYRHFNLLLFYYCYFL